MLVHPPHPTTTFPTSLPQLAPNHGAETRPVPLPSSEGCEPGAIASREEIAKGKENQGGTREMGGPGGA